MATRCIICGEMKAGLPVADDFVIDTIRWLKKNVTKDEQGNTLVVCKQDYAAYKKARDRYSFRQKFYIGVGALLSIVGLLISPALQTFLLAIIVILFMYALALLSYIPKLKVEPRPQKPKKAAT